MEDSYRRGHLRRDVCPASKQKAVILNAHRGGPARPAGGHEGSQRKQSVIQSSTCEASEAEILRGHLVGSAQNDSALVWRRRAKVTWRWHFFVASLPPRCHSEESAAADDEESAVDGSTDEKQIPRRLKNASLGMTSFRCVTRLETNAVILNASDQDA